MDNDDLTAKLYVTYIFRRAAKDLARIDRHHLSRLEEVAEVSGDDNADPSTARHGGGCLDDQMTENLSEDEDSNEMRFGAERLIDESNLIEQPRIDMNPKEVSLSKKPFREVKPEIKVKLTNEPPIPKNNLLNYKSHEAINERQERVRNVQYKIKQKGVSTQSQKSQKHQPKSEKHKKGHIELTLGREVFMTSQPDLLSIPFDYEAEIMVKDKHVHRPAPIHERIVEIDKKIEELRLKRDLQERFPKAQESIYPGEDLQIIETSDRVKNWHRDRAEREARLAKRREKEARKADEKIKEENEKKDKDRRLQKRIRLANCEARIHEMNHYRVERDQMNRYQNKVVGELLRHPRTFYYYQASEEALQKVKDKNKGKFHSHKVKLDEQQGRLEYYERQFGEQE